MKAKTGVRPTDSVIWSGKWTANTSADAGNEKEEGNQAKSRHRGRGNQSDQMLFSRLLNEAAEQQEESPAQAVDEGERCRHYFQKMKKSNERIQHTLYSKNRENSSPVTIPSTLGASLSEATGKLHHLYLRVSGVAREYSANIPEGHIITQTPSPGSRVSGQTGVFLVVSKGLPPTVAKRKMASFWNMLAAKAANPPQSAHTGCDGIKVTFSSPLEAPAPQAAAQRPLSAGVKAR